MSVNEKFPLSNILLSGVRAFLGRITPEIISIGIRADYEERKIEIVVSLDRIASEDVIEEISCAETEMMSDFSPELMVETVIITPDKRSIENQGHGDVKLIFERRNL